MNAFLFDDDVFDNSTKLTLSVLQAAEMLSMYRAELARVLKVQCSDVGELTSVKKTLLSGGESWHLAVSFLRFYNAQYFQHDGVSIAMCHWMHTSNETLDGVLLLMIVDDGLVRQVVDYLESTNLV